VLRVVLIVLLVANAMVCEAFLPDQSSLCVRGHVLANPIGESTLNQLHGTFKRDIRGGREEQMQMIGHDYKLMQRVFLLFPIMLQHVDHQFRRLSVAEQRCAPPGYGRDKEGSIEGHPRNGRGATSLC